MKNVRSSLNLDLDLSQSRAAIRWVRVWMEKQQITMVTFDQVTKIYERGGDRITGLDRVTVEVAKGDF